MGLHRAGHEVVAMVEWDKATAGVAKHNYPNVPIYCDVQNLDPKDLPEADCLIYSFPCQDLSNAGKRLGFSGNRSSLYSHAIRIIQYLRTRGLRYSLAENVCGLHTSNNGDDFARLLRDLLDVGHNSIGWTILDSRYIGFSFPQGGGGNKRGIRKAVPQRRRRVFVLGTLGNRGGECASEILAFSERSKGHIKEGEGSRETKQDAQTIEGDATETSTARSTGVDVYNGIETGQTASTLTTGVGIPNASGPKLCVSWNGDTTPKNSINISMTLRSQQGGEGVGVAYQDGIRRFTPKECERLTGLPDNFTEYAEKVTLDGNLWISENSSYKLSDTQRYKILGNAITANCTEWIARRIENYERQKGNN